MGRPTPWSYNNKRMHVPPTPPHPADKHDASHARPCPGARHCRGVRGVRGAGDIVRGSGGSGCPTFVNWLDAIDQEKRMHCRGSGGRMRKFAKPSGDIVGGPGGVWCVRPFHRFGTRFALIRCRHRYDIGATNKFGKTPILKTLKTKWGRRSPRRPHGDPTATPLQNH